MRRELGAGPVTALSRADWELLETGVDPAAWLEGGQVLRLAAVAREHACGGSWTRFHELCAQAVQRIGALGYRAVLRAGDPDRTFAALSVLWRASFGSGRAVADTDPRGATVHVFDGVAVDELEGNLHAGWCLGVAWLTGVDAARLELRRRPWAADEGDEQVVRIDWREPVQRPAPAPPPYPSIRGKLPAASVG
ncbi:MAG: hypothetical protein R6X02_28600 [Enhygromyxa sp.]